MLELSLIPLRAPAAGLNTTQILAWAVQGLAAGLGEAPCADLDEHLLRSSMQTLSNSELTVPCSELGISASAGQKHFHTNQLLPKLRRSGAGKRTNLKVQQFLKHVKAQHSHCPLGIGSALTHLPRSVRDHASTGHLG